MNYVDHFDGLIQVRCFVCVCVCVCVCSAE